jgi:glycosylphosphatidylinositol phospholipase D
MVKVYKSTSQTLFRAVSLMRIVLCNVFEAGLVRTFWCLSILVCISSPGFVLAAVSPNDLSILSDFNVRFDHLGGDNADPGFQSIAVGDLNGDGIPDLAIGVPGASTDGRSGNGTVYIIYGPLPTGTGNVIPLNVSSNFNVRLDGAVRSFGYSLAIGDVNGDGRADLVVGAPFENGGLGAVYVIPGSFPSGTGQTKDMAVTTNYSVEYIGDLLGSNPDYVGYSLVLADLDGDGAQEIAMGAPNAARDVGVKIPVYGPGIGKVYVTSGPSPSDVGMSVSLSVPSNYRLLVLGDGSCTNGNWLCRYNADSFGAALETGDWNHDGLKDLAIGAPNEYGVFVLYGPIPGGNGNVKDMKVAADFNVRFTGGTREVSLTKGDFNADGKTDLAIGTKALTLNASGPSSNDVVYLFYNPLPAGVGNLVNMTLPADYNVRLDGPASGAVTNIFIPPDAQFGKVTLAAGDMDGDGNADLLFGGRSMGSMGRSGNGWDFQWPGPFPNGTGNNLGMDTSSVTQYAGPVTDAQAGFAVRAGDMNYDGRLDWIIGCPGFPGSAVYVIYQVPPPAPTPTITATLTPTPVVADTPTTTLTPTPTFSLTPSPTDLFWVSKNRHRQGEAPVVIKVGPFAAGRYILKVYNSAGELVRTLRDATASEGAYESVEWEGRNKDEEPVASGVYLIAYTNGTKTRFAKLVVLR